MGVRGSLLIGAVTLIVLAVVLPGVAQARTTFGHNLGVPPSSLLFDNFTAAIETLRPAAQAPGGATAPFDGVITRWRIRKDASVGLMQVAFRAVRGSLSVHQGQRVALGTAEGIYGFEERIPVRQGDQIGIDSDTAVLIPVVDNATGSTYDYWTPAFMAHPGPDPPNGTVAAAPLINADIEPDADGDGFGDDSQDRCPLQAATQEKCDLASGIDSGPKTKTKKRRATFTFAGVGSVTFECGVDGARFSACSSPFRTKKLKPGKHVFEVRALGVDGADGPLTEYRWRIKR